MDTLLRREIHWSCPNCTETAVTHRANETKFHNCRGLFLLWCPMVVDGTRCKVEAIEREDFVGKEDVQLDARGRPVMAVQVTREHGADRTVYAPCAHARLEELK